MFNNKKNLIKTLMDDNERMREKEKNYDILSSEVYNNLDGDKQLEILKIESRYCDRIELSKNYNFRIYIKIYEGLEQSFPFSTYEYDKIMDNKTISINQISKINKKYDDDNKKSRKILDELELNNKKVSDLTRIELVSLIREIK